MEINTGFIFSHNFQHASASHINQTILARAETQNYQDYSELVRCLPSLNSQCMNIVSGQSSYDGFTPMYASTNMQNGSLSPSEYSQIFESLTTVPIYDEVLKEKKVVAQYSDRAYIINSKSTSSMESEFDLISRKRRAIEQTIFQDQDSTISDSHSGSLNISSMILSKQFDKISNESSQNGVSTIYQPLENLGMPVHDDFRGYANRRSNDDELYTDALKFQISESSPMQRGYYSGNFFDSVSKNSEASIDQKTKMVTKCEHTSRKHYAKGMCSTCYHKTGRTKTAWNCEHKNELHYAKGCCQECYLIFHSKRGKNKLKKLLRERRKQNAQNQKMQNQCNPSANFAQF